MIHYTVKKTMILQILKLQLNYRENYDLMNSKYQ
jgi:hypothetical protein